MQALFVHAKKPKLVGRAESILCGTQRTQVTFRLFKREHSVDDMLRGFWTRNEPVFGDMRHKNDDRIVRLGPLCKVLRIVFDLVGSAGNGACFGRVHGLY